MSTMAPVTPIEITFRFDFHGEYTPEVAEALNSLAQAMGNQAEHGLYSLGSRDAESDEQENILLGDLSGWSYPRVRRVVDSLPTQTERKSI